MNIVPNYVFISKLLIFINNHINKILFFFPYKFYFDLKFSKIVKTQTQKTMKENLSRVIGDFTEIGCVLNVHKDKEKILNDAENVINHRFNILGSGLVYLNPIDWHTDFKTNYTWPKGKYFKRYRGKYKSENPDIKVPWELSRCHHLLWLGEAYLITNNEKYSREIIDQISFWIDDNPVMRSINWTCAMDVSIRAVNWIYSLNMIIDSPYLKDKMCKKIVKSLLIHSYYIFNNLEKGFLYSNNHYFSNLSGLLFLGEFFKSYGIGCKIYNFAKKEFFNEIRIQVLPSGVHFEKSISYHRLVTELALYPLAMLKRTDVEIPLDIKHRVITMLEYICVYLKDNGLAPLLADNDDGRFLPFVNYDFRDHTYLAAMLTLFNNKKNISKYSDFLPIDSFFIFPDNEKNNSKITSYNTFPINSKVFYDAGIAIIRNEYIYVLFCNSSLANYNDKIDRKVGAHSHSDLLSFEMSYRGNDIFIDPGAYLYTSSISKHKEFRSTRKHNTISIDGVNQHTLSRNDFFSFTNSTMPSVLNYANSDLEQIISGYYVLNNNNDKIKHFRSMKINESNIVIKDVVNSISNHSYEVLFHLAPSFKYKIIDRKSILLNSNILSVIISFSSESNILLRVEDDTFSPSYGVLEASNTIVVSCELESNFSIETNIEIINFKI